jgi:hypothetical protein
MESRHPEHEDTDEGEKRPPEPVYCAAFKYSNPLVEKTMVELDGSGHLPGELEAMRGLVCENLQSSGHRIKRTLHHVFSVT